MTNNINMIDMKTQIRKSTTTLLLAMIFTAGLMAQPGQGRGIYQNENCRMTQVIPDLSDDQIASLKELRNDQLQSTQTYKNKMGEIQARQRTLMSETPIDQKASGKLIDEKTSLMNEHMKQSISHQADISNVLTEDQQVVMNQMKNRNQQFAQRGGRGNGNFQKGRANARQGRQGFQGRQGGQNRNFKQNAGRGWR